MLIIQSKAFLEGGGGVKWGQGRATRQGED